MNNSKTNNSIFENIKHIDEEDIDELIENKKESSKTLL